MLCEGCKENNRVALICHVIIRMGNNSIFLQTKEPVEDRQNATMTFLFQLCFDPGTEAPFESKINHVISHVSYKFFGISELILKSVVCGHRSRGIERFGLTANSRSAYSLSMKILECFQHFILLVHTVYENQLVLNSKQCRIKNNISLPSSNQLIANGRIGYLQGGV